MLLAVLNTDPMSHSYGGVAPFMRHMHPWLSQHFDVRYLTLPAGPWRSCPGSMRVKYLLWLLLHSRSLREADIVLSHTVEGSVVASWLHVPYAHIYHGNSNPMTISRFRFGHWFVPMYEAMFRRIARTAALRYTVGPARCDEERSIHNPQPAFAALVPAHQRRGFLFAGRLEAMKRVERIIAAYALLPPDVRAGNPLYIAGYGSEEQRLRALQAAGVVFLGNVPSDDMLALHATKRILLMASTTEGMPTAIAEALTAGVPVVATAVGAIPHVVRDGTEGRLLPVDYDDRQYADAILDILTHYLRYAEAAHKRATLFNAETITNEIANDLQHVLFN